MGRWVVGLALLACVGVSGAAGQERGERRQRKEERRQEAFRMVDAYVIANIQESLGLDEDTYAKVVPVVNSLQKARREYFRDRAQSLHGMRRLLRSGTATEAQVRQQLEALKTLEAEGPERIREQMDALDALLTPLQQAKYRVFEVEVERRLRVLMRQGRRERTAEPG
jgi:Spy/CpxP family protein refolding chaperone